MIQLHSLNQEELVFLHWSVKQTLVVNFYGHMVPTSRNILTNQMQGTLLDQLIVVLQALPLDLREIRWSIYNQWEWTFLWMNSVIRSNQDFSKEYQLALMLYLLLWCFPSYHNQKLRSLFTQYNDWLKFAPDQWANRKILWIYL